LKKQVHSLEKENKTLSSDLQIAVDTLEKIEKQLHTAMVEMSKMRTRIIKLKRRRHVNIDEKICKLCG